MQNTQYVKASTIKKMQNTQNVNPQQKKFLYIDFEEILRSRGLV